jgi:hypothetical protein
MNEPYMDEPFMPEPYGGIYCDHDGKPCSPAVGDCLCPCYECWVRRTEHDCPKQAFLEDPITEHYGVGGEFVGSIPCAVCDAEQ